MNFSASGFGSALRCTSSRRKSGFNGLDRKRRLFLSAEGLATGEEKRGTKCFKTWGADVSGLFVRKSTRYIQLFRPSRDFGGNETRGSAASAPELFKLP